MDVRSPATSLAVTRVATHDHTTRDLVMLHGIYGRGRNWLGIARSLTTMRPEYACWLVDLPHHGASGPGAHGDTVHGLAADVLDWLGASAVVPTAILGHSYGGKVALALAAAMRDTPLQVWVIDSTPEVKPPSGSAYDLLGIIRRLPPRFHSREEAQQALVAHGYTVGVAQWMSGNLVRHGESFRWRLDFDVIQRLLLDFFQTDLWAVVEHSSPHHEIHVLKASQSSVITPDAERRLEAARRARVHLHHREGGHWIHAESPGVVTGLLVEWLPGEGQARGK